MQPQYFKVSGIVSVHLRTMFPGATNTMTFVVYSHHVREHVRDGLISCHLTLTAEAAQMRLLQYTGIVSVRFGTIATNISR